MCHYSEPFNAECRAFGRLQETGREALAVKCYGYVLLDEHHERVLMDRFNDTYDEDTDTNIHFNGDGDVDSRDDVDFRSLFPTMDGRKPPLRGIVKALGEGFSEERGLSRTTARKLLGNTIKLQQLGIFNIDMHLGQLIDDNIVDFSTAITIPHFLTNPELNPRLNAGELASMEEELFKVAIRDYWRFDAMISEWNDCCDWYQQQGLSPQLHPEVDYSKMPNRKRRLAVTAFPVPRRCPGHFFSSNPNQACRATWWTHVDLRAQKRINKAPVRNGILKRRNLPARPPRWYCGKNIGEGLGGGWHTWKLGWDVREGLLFPEKRVRRD